MKRKIFLVFVLANLFFFLSTFDLDAWIASRIKGRVVDEATGEPLNEVTVRLYCFREGRSFATKRTKTNAKGIFVFDDLKKDKYFLQFKKNGYVGFPNEYAFIYTNDYSKILEIMNLNEGDIRFVLVQMKRGASVKGTVYLKDLSGVRAIQQEDPKNYPRVEVNLYRKVKAEEKDIFSLEWMEYEMKLLERDGTYFLNGLEPKNTYELVIAYPGFFSHVETLEVPGTESFEIDHTFDSTDKTGLSVKVFVDNEPHNADLKLRDMSDKKYLGTFLKDENGRHVLKNAQPGHYNLSVWVDLSEPETYISKLIPIVIEEGKTLILDLKY